MMSLTLLHVLMTLTLCFMMNLDSVCLTMNLTLCLTMNLTLCDDWLCCTFDDDLSCDLPRCPSRGTPADWMSQDPAAHPTPHWPRYRTLTSSQTHHLKWQLYDRFSSKYSNIITRIMSKRYILWLKYNEMKISYCCSFKYYTRFKLVKMQILYRCVLVSVEIYYLLKLNIRDILLYALVCLNYSLSTYIYDWYVYQVTRIKNTKNWNIACCHLRLNFRSIIVKYDPKVNICVYLLIRCHSGADPLGYHQVKYRTICRGTLGMLNINTKHPYS